MIGTNNVSVRFGARTLYKDVNLKFTDGNCYGLIGANGAGKSTFLKVLSGELKPDTGDVFTGPNETVFTLEQDHYKFEEFPVLETVMMGNERLYAIMKEKEYLYTKEGEFTDEDGVKAGELEEEFANLDGWNAESEAANLLEQLDIPVSLHQELMSAMTPAQKVKILLAQALFGKPNTLLLDEPTSSMDLKNQLKVLGLIREVTREKGLVTIVSIRDLNLAAMFCDRFLMMKDGGIYRFGRAEEVLTESCIREVYGVEAEVWETEPRRILLRDPEQNIPLSVPFQ